MRLINTILHADCVRVLPNLQTASVDFVLTDPPCVLNDDNPVCLKTAFREIFRTLKEDRHCVSFYGWPKADLFIQAFNEAGFRIAAHLVFPMSCVPAAGHVGYHLECSYILAKGKPPLPNNPFRDVVRTYSGNRSYPTEKPLAVLLPLVDAFTQPGGLVLDPFAGSGSSLLAAKRLSRTYLGMEIDANCYATAERRLATEAMAKHTARSLATAGHIHVRKA